MKHKRTDNTGEEDFFNPKLETLNKQQRKARKSRKLKMRIKKQERKG